jgi:hypothetical protein
MFARIAVFYKAVSCRFKARQASFESGRGGFGLGTTSRAPKTGTGRIERGCDGAGRRRKIKPIRRICIALGQPLL